MFIPVSCGQLRFRGNRSFIVHRSTSNHVIETSLVKARPDDNLGNEAEATAYLKGELGLADGAQVSLDGFLVGDFPSLKLAVRVASGPPGHSGMLLIEGARSFLNKGTGTRLLKRAGDPVLATEMLRNCGKDHGDQILVFGFETISSGGQGSIEIDSVEGC